MQESLEWMTVAQVAAALGCSVQTVGRLCEKKRLPARDIGTGRHRIWRIPRTALNHDAATQAGSGSAPARRRGKALVVPKLI
jgi:excisionase family DNA binding protein